MNNLLVLAVFLFVLETEYSWAKCAIVGSNQNNDVVTSLVQNAEICPKNVLEFTAILAQDGLVSKSYMVANRGFHNPRWGSFSVFETVSGQSKSMNRKVIDEDLYFGHFTVKNQSNTIVLDQLNLKGKLLIEVMAYDWKKNAYNFYELIGGISKPTWFYRGDSFDIFEDNMNLKLGKSKASKLRCSACHISGGPILKELEYPHSDWWTKEMPLPMGSSKISYDLQLYLDQLKDVSHFSASVKKGMKRIAKPELGIQQKLRPLFCTTEINLKSDSSMDTNILKISADIFVNPLLNEEVFLTMERNLYEDALEFYGSKFPETNLSDSQYAFHAPVKAYSNIEAIKKLVKDGVIDEEFMLDILAYDFKHPLFSKKRCDFLKLIENELDWRGAFLEKLNRSGRYVSLVSDLSKTNKKSHLVKVKNYLRDLQMSFSTAEGVIESVSYLSGIRESVYDDEISKNPRGQILEPGFRIVFPEMIKPPVEDTNR
ncbi:MAG: hypothetical protein VYA54_08605 [Bdellovibrionota bacterium]|nr:hypothetical protein [Bdellovibrionota bacterium]